MYVCMCIHMCACECMCAFVCMCMCVCAGQKMCVCMYVFVGVYVFVCRSEDNVRELVLVSSSESPGLNSSPKAWQQAPLSLSPPDSLSLNLCI